MTIFEADPSEGSATLFTAGLLPYLGGGEFARFNDCFQGVVSRVGYDYCDGVWIGFHGLVWVVSL